MRFMVIVMVAAVVGLVMLDHLANYGQYTRAVTDFIFP